LAPGQNPWEYMVNNHVFYRTCAQKHGQTMLTTWSNKVKHHGPIITRASASASTTAGTGAGTSARLVTKVDWV
jgi:hypothetical protein